MHPTAENAPGEATEQESKRLLFGSAILELDTDH